VDYVNELNDRILREIEKTGLAFGC
jgi:hypothetical protein